MLSFRRAPRGARATAVGVGLLCAAALLGTPAAAQVYVLEEITGLPGNRSIAYRVNNMGQVTGIYQTAGGPERAFLWTNGVVRDLGTLGGASATPNGINNRGEIVGSSGINPESSPDSWIDRAFLWRDGVLQDLGTLGGSQSEATAINDARQVVGIADAVDPSGDEVGRHAFLWEQGTMRDLGTLGGSYSAALDINSGGQVIGYASTSEHQPHAFLWRNGTMVDLGIQDGLGSAAIAINDTGLVLGEWEIGGGVSQPFLWRDGVVHPLVAPAGSLLEVKTLNNRGQVLGTLSPRRGRSFFFLYTETEGILDLRDRILPHPDWHPEALFDLNDTGDIVGCAQHRGRTRAIRLRALLGGRLEAPEKVAIASRRAGKPVIQSFRITNTGTEPIAGRVGVLTAPFAVISGAGSYLLHPGKSRQIRVRFTPRSDGETVTVPLAITTSDPSAPKVTVSIESSTPPLTGSR